MKIFSPNPPPPELKISKFQLSRTLGVAHYGRGIQAKFTALVELSIQIKFKTVAE